MDSKSTLSCDIKTGVCSPSEDISEQNILSTNESLKSKLKVIYYYDALCGWCYGFGPHLEKFVEEFKDDIEIEVISGGLFLGNRIGRINDVASYIKSGAYKSVEAATGTKFGEPFLKRLFGEGDITLNSLPPAIALCIVKEVLPAKEFEFAEILLKAIYNDGINPVNIKDYKGYVAIIGLDFELFSIKMEEDKYKEMAIKEFEVFKSSGYTGMPTLVLEKDNEQILLSNGYLDFNSLSDKLNSYINK